MPGTINNARNVNVGASHEELIPNWLGITIWGGNYQKLKKIGIQGGIPIYEHIEFKGRVINHNVNLGLPFTSSSVHNIYSSHFIEHLNYQEGINFLKETHRVLKPGSVVRIICPDIKKWICKLYEKNDDNFFEIYRKALDIDYYENELYTQQHNMVTRSQVFNSMIFNWGHKWMWDFESLKLELTKIGFNKINRVSKSVGEMEDLLIIENRLSPDKIYARDLESLYVEAIK